MHLQGPPGSVCANEMVFEATVRKHTFSNCQKAGKLLQEVNVLSLHLSIDFSSYSFQASAHVCLPDD